MELKTGMKYEMDMTVTEADTAAAVDGILLPVFSTPRMIALMEATCAHCVQSALQQGEGTVGMSIEVKHFSPTPIDGTVRCECRLMEVDSKKLTFEVNAFDEKGQIGIAIHKRAIIDNVKFMSRIKAK